MSSLSNRILNVFNNTEPDMWRSTMFIAKVLFGAKEARKKMVNPTLYRLQKDGKLKRKHTPSGVMWALATKGHNSTSGVSNCDTPPVTRPQRKTNAQLIKEFTDGVQGYPCPDKPVGPLTRDEVKFLLRMGLSEMHEIAKTVCTDSAEALDLLKECLGVDVSAKKPCPKGVDPDVWMMAEQVDGVVDLEYYAKNVLAKKGLNAGRVFALVHQANMDKRDPKTKQFIRRQSDGKVLKRDGWQSPNVAAEIERQLKEGAWD